MATIGSLLQSHKPSPRRVDERFQVLFQRESTELVCVGKLDIGRINSLLHMNFRDGKVFIHNGTIDHIESCHRGIYEMYRNRMASLIEFPTMVGKNPTEKDSIELYDLSVHLIMGIKRDRQRGYLFCASMYVLDDWDRKIRDRLAGGRIKRYV